MEFINKIIGGIIMKTEKIVKRTEMRRITRTSTTPTNRTSADSLKTELNTWLTTRTVWNHGDWETLLEDLRTKGFSDLIDTQRGRDAIGLYLETNKKRAC